MINFDNQLTFESQMGNSYRAMNTTTAHPKVSPKYRHINTAEVVQSFVSHGWVPVKYTEAYTKKYQGYQTHTVQLTHMDTKVTDVGDCTLRIIIVNNHHASKCMEIKLGLYRLVCSNGLVVEDANIESLKLRHIGTSIDAQISEFVDRIQVAAEQLRARIAELSTRKMTREAAREFARTALTTRFKPELITNELVDAALHANRPEDMGDDAWRIFNTVQEKIINGFQTDTGKVRRITSISRNLAINSRLWQQLTQLAA